jgi:hypothetical protein
MRSPRADGCDPLPGGSGSPVGRQKDRSARSVLNSWRVRRTGKTPCAPCLEETRFWSRAIGAMADGECRGEAPEGERALESGAQPRKRQLLGQCAFRRPASLFVVEANLFAWWSAKLGRGNVSRERYSVSTPAEGASEQTIMRAPRKTIHEWRRTCCKDRPERASRCAGSLTRCRLAQRRAT